VALVALGGAAAMAAEKTGAAAPADSTGPAGLGLAVQATRAFAKHRTDSPFVVSALASPNQYLRKLALEHLLDARGVVDSAVITAVIPLLAETTLLPPVWCAEMYDRQRAGIKDAEEDSEGPAPTIDCRRSSFVSNGSLAARLLVGRQAFPSVIAFVQRKPQAADAVVLSLGTAALQPASQVLPALATGNRPDVQAALLRFIVVAPCDATGSSRIAHSVSRFAGSPNATVRQMASLAVLHLAACGPHDDDLAGLRKHAASALEARLRDLDDHEAVPQVGWLGTAADVLIDALLARFARLPSDQEGRGAILRVFARVGPAASPAIPVLITVLEDRKQAPLWSSAREAVGSIGPQAARAKSAILWELRESSFELLPPAVTTLARIDAKLDPAEFAALVRAYRKDCEIGGGLPTESGSDACPEVSKSLARLATLGGHVSPKSPVSPAYVPAVR
jgi:hypothetical protein